MASFSRFDLPYLDPFELSRISKSRSRGMRIVEIVDRNCSGLTREWDKCNCPHFAIVFSVYRMTLNLPLHDLVKRRDSLAFVATKLSLSLSIAFPCPRVLLLIHARKKTRNKTGERKRTEKAYHREYFLIILVNEMKFRFYWRYQSKGRL